MKKIQQQCAERGNLRRSWRTKRGTSPTPKGIEFESTLSSIIQRVVLSTYIIVPHLKDSTREKLGMYALSLVESFKNLTIYSTSVVSFLAYSGEYATLALTTS